MRLACLRESEDNGLFLITNLGLILLKPASNAGKHILYWEVGRARVMNDQPDRGELHAVFYQPPNSYVFAVDANTGAVKWTCQLQAEPLYSPLWFNGAIFVTDVDRLTSLSAMTGALYWTISTNGYWLTNPIGVDTLVNVYETSDAGSQN